MIKHREARVSPATPNRVVCNAEDPYPERVTREKNKMISERLILILDDDDMDLLIGRMNEKKPRILEDGICEKLIVFCWGYLGLVMIGNLERIWEACVAHGAAWKLGVCLLNIYNQIMSLCLSILKDPLFGLFK